jgi:hypothetical protein
MAPKNSMAAHAREFATYCYGAAEQSLPGYTREYFLWRARTWEEYARKVQTDENALVESPSLSPV